MATVAHPGIDPTDRPISVVALIMALLTALRFRATSQTQEEVLLFLCGLVEFIVSCYISFKRERERESQIWPKWDHSPSSPGRSAPLAPLNRTKESRSQKGYLVCKRYIKGMEFLPSCSHSASDVNPIYKNPNWFSCILPLILVGVEFVFFFFQFSPLFSFFHSIWFNV